MTEQMMQETAGKTIPAGYKQTEVGVIPEDWDVCELQEAVEFLDGQRRPIKSGDRAKIAGIYPYYGASGIVDYVNDYIFDEQLILLGEDGENILSRNVPLAFKVSGKIWVNNHAHVLKPKEDFHIGYLTELLESIDYSLLNSGTAQPKLNKQTCQKIKVIKPRHKEQTAIANVLSDSDALFDALEQLIAKKQAIKSATMQQLLTGRTRLPAFALRPDGTPKGYKPSELGDIPDDWEEISIGQDAVLKARIGWQALTTKEYQVSGDIYLVTGIDFDAGAVMWDKCCYVSEWRYKQDTNIQLRENDVLITKDGTVGKVGYVSALEKPATLNSGVFVIRPKNNSFVPRYLFYVLTSRLFNDFMNQITAGSTITHLYQKDFVNFEFSAPNIEEQTAIATILSDMDNELQALTQKLEKARALKQGMMQQLLTGKIRLPLAAGA
ncbi:restriction endonuclease subunit S [Aeromonas caviae]